MRNKLIAIYGASGSGKSTLANDILKRFGGDSVAIISQDNYYHSSVESEVEGFDEPLAIDFYLLERHLEELLDNKEVESPVYDFSTHSRLDVTDKILPKKVVIVEGTLIMNSGFIEKLSSYAIYCDIDIDICFIRRLVRDVTDRGRSLDGSIAQYLNEVRPSFFKYIDTHKHKRDFLYNQDNKSDLYNSIRVILENPNYSQ